MKKLSIFLIFISSIYASYYYLELIKNKNIFVKRIILQSINEIIELDKDARIFYMKQKGLKRDEIDNNIFSLDESYENERKKIYKYCLDKKLKYCHLHSDLTGFLSPYVHVVLSYEFDVNSSRFFNQMYIFEYANNKKYIGTINGINSLKYNNNEAPFSEYRDNYIDGGVDFQEIRQINSNEEIKYYNTKEKK